MLVHGLRAAQAPGAGAQGRTTGAYQRRRRVTGRSAADVGAGTAVVVLPVWESRRRPGEDSMSSEIMDAEPDGPDQAAVENERGALVAVLVMVVLGVAGIFAVST
ncbi:hypothetical protein C6361_23880 [Plantactinospora sp. BC1]|nr:hypothetical protein C6361_23880 [Plantactinospora sp. BC1]AVT40443.1 hypothetical protein C6W10_32760 [Plantactinospora sp. BB1]